MTVLFLCWANSARSQMAEGLARRVLGSGFRVMSAGSYPVGVNPYAIEVMREIEIDISHHRSKAVSEVDLSSVDVVITLCKEQVCPTLPKAIHHEHWPVADPAGRSKTHEEKLVLFRKTRDEITKKLEAWRENLRTQ